MQQKPGVAMIFLRAEWQDCPDARKVHEAIEQDTRQMMDRLSRHLDILGPWVVSSAETLLVCKRALQEADPDLVALAYQTHVEDSLLEALLSVLGSRPLVFWGYQPWRRPPHQISPALMLRANASPSAFGALGILRNLDVPFFFTFGSPDDPRLIVDLYTAGQAARLMRDLRQARFGLVAAPAAQPSTAHKDTARLAAAFGASMLHIPPEEYLRTVRAVDPRQVQAYIDRLEDVCPVRGVSPETLQIAAQAAVGLEQLAQHHHLDVLSLDERDPVLGRELQMRPGLYPDLLDEREAIYLPGGDADSALACYILQRLAGEPTMLLEMWFIDEPMNQVIGGRGGPQNPALAGADRPVVTPDQDLCRPSGTQGAQMEWMAKPGRVTLFQLRATPTGWQATAATGVSLEDQPQVAGCPHALLRLDSPLVHFLNRIAAVGADPQWALVHGTFVNEIEAFCDMLDIPLERIVD